MWPFKKEKNKTAIPLGSKARDTFTGFEGMVIGRTEWLYGCIRIGIQAPGLKDGKPLEAEWFDEQRVELVKEDKPKISPDSSATTGGPQKDPKY